MHSGGSGLSIDIHFVDIELSYDVLSPLPTLLSKHFNHPHPYIEIATAISDTHTGNRKQLISLSHLPPTKMGSSHLASLSGWCLVQVERRSVGAGGWGCGSI